MLVPTLAASCAASIVAYFNYKHDGVGLLLDGLKDIFKHKFKTYSDRIWEVVYTLRDSARHIFYEQRIKEINHYRLLPVSKFTEALAALGPYMTSEQGGTCVGLSDAGDRFLCTWGNLVVDTGIRFNELQVSWEQYLTASERIYGLIKTIDEYRESKKLFFEEQRARRTKGKTNP